MARRPNSHQDLDAVHLGHIEFTYKDVLYDIDVNRRRGIVEFEVHYPRRSQIGDALKRFRRRGNESGSVTGTTRKTKFLILVDNE